ncbi:hypothetical protein [Methylobacterium dankookense]|uniref:Uncharacterized protein n=1 Tax=Methylobacterium dankookense TaxID=560405 RepID=A0A564G525_9HYPH|nr:hypothetical protein [Methylobacterium dankookense]GJD58362.1 hypothetical protein IFDJLNFL_4281 [Methylobacterium dankookense]VUF15633.1 hypothetical protein MTDSW087_05377 [Methylobacterium dankookense]
MKMIAIQSVKADGKLVSPGAEFDVGSAEEAKALIVAGAAREKGKADEGVKVVPVAENTAPRGTASGVASPSDPASIPAATQAVADAAKGQTRGR